jgi:hypothetical protein
MKIRDLQDQQRIIGHLLAGVELAFLFARMGVHRIQRGDPSRADRSISRARDEIRVVQQFEEIIADANVRRRIHDITREFDHVLTDLSSASRPQIRPN